MEKTSIENVLSKIQKELKAPKNQFNNFGKYNYRSCEDILEAIKPLLPDNFIVLLNDEIVQIGERYYVKATATLKTSQEGFSVNAYARESENKKGMDSSQTTGASSSYARKYALNGLFLIDDTKDPDVPTQKEVSRPSSVNEKTPQAEKEEKTQFQLNEIGDWLMEMAGGNKDVARDILKQTTAYKDFEGYINLKALGTIKKRNPSQFYAIYKKIEGKYEEYQTSINAGEKFNVCPEEQPEIPF